MIASLAPLRPTVTVTPAETDPGQPAEYLLADADGIPVGTALHCPGEGWTVATHGNPMIVRAPARTFSGALADAGVRAEGLMIAGTYWPSYTAYTASLGLDDDDPAGE